MTSNGIVVQDDPGRNYLFIPGKPQPQGSTKAYVVGGHARITHANEATMPWRALIAAMIGQYNGPGITYPLGPVAIRADFVIPRRVNEPKRVTPPHTRKPDSDKLVRAVLDAMTGLVFTDDAQVTSINATKRTARIGEQPGVHLLWAPGHKDASMTLRSDLLAILATADPPPREMITQAQLERFADAILAANWAPRLGIRDALDVDDE